MQDRNENIIRKIQGLLALANNNSNEEEAQSAFMMAQKLMFKHDITMSELDVGQDSLTIEKGQATVHKKLFWWERELANIMSENFRVKNYINSKRLDGDLKRKRAVMFMGFEKDVALAKEMYLLAYEVLLFYSKRFVEEYYESYINVLRTNKTTNELKNSYMRGFLAGLDSKFQEQVAKMKEENALMVLVPKEVEEEYNSMFDGTKPLNLNIPPIEEIIAYEQGYKDGNEVDYTRRTINDEVFEY